MATERVLIHPSASTLVYYVLYYHLRLGLWAYIRAPPPVACHAPSALLWAWGGPRPASGPGPISADSCWRGQARSGGLGPAGVCAAAPRGHCPGGGRKPLRGAAQAVSVRGEKRGREAEKKRKKSGR